MKDDKMTLQEYIENMNYKRRLLSTSKSKEKHQAVNQNPSIPKIITYPVNNVKIVKQTQKLPEMSQLANKIKQIDQNTQSFSLIHKKVQGIKQFVRQFIQNDKIFVNFCKKMFQLESCYRLELIEAYRYQLFRYQFDNKNMMDEQKKKILKELNDFYMSSKYEYKKVILKEHDQKNIKKTKRSEKDIKRTSINRQFSSQKNVFSSESKLPITSQVKSARVINSNLFANAIYKNNQDITSIQNLYLKDQAQNEQQGQNGLRYTRSPSSKKVVFIANSPINQTTKEYEIPDFSPIKKPVDYNPQDYQQDEQSNIDIHSEAASSQSDAKDMIRFMSKQSLQGKLFKTKEYQPQKNVKSNKIPESNRKKTFRQTQMKKQRQQLLQSKDYLKVQKR